MSKDSSVEDFLFSMGRDERRRFKNSQFFFHQLKFGFEDIHFNVSGWLINPVFENEDLFEFGSSALPDMVRIKVGMGKNGKWISGQDLNFGDSGEGTGYSIFEKPHISKQAAFDTSYVYCLNKLSAHIIYEENVKHKDVSFTKINNIKATIVKMKEYVASKKQLSLF